MLLLENPVYRNWPPKQKELKLKKEADRVLFIRDLCTEAKFWTATGQLVTMAQGRRKKEFSVKRWSVANECTWFSQEIVYIPGST